MKQKSFGDHFKFAFDSFGIGMPPPTSLFVSVSTGIATLTTLAGLIEQYGSKVTVREILMTVPAGTVSAAFALELGKIAGGCLAAAYAGVCVGAFVYAVGEYSADRLWTIDKPDPSAKKLIPACRKNGVNITPKFKQYLNTDFSMHLNMKKCFKAH